MPRLRQQYPQNYGSSTNINTEFENLIRYMNAAELGNNTLGELLAKIFNENGQFDGPIEFRKDSSSGIEYRIGEYVDPEAGWQTLLANDEIRGAPGRDVGDIGAPIFHQRVDYLAGAAQTTFDYAHVATDEILVYVNGILKRPGAAYDYTTSTTGGAGFAGAVIFNAGLSLNDKVSIFKVRSTAITGYTRVDTYTVASQAVFPFIFDAGTKLQVYKNGILQREGGAYDYTTQPDLNTITFTTAVPTGNLVTILTVENVSAQAVTGLMLEGTYTDATTGLIPFAKIQIANNEIPQAKVANLSSSLSNKAKLTVSSSTPATPTTGDLWHDTSQTPNQLKFYDGIQWLRTSPDSSLPTFNTGNAGQYVRVNGAGTSLEYAGIDLTSVIPITQKGAANGVASLDSTGRLPASQLPSTLSSQSFYDIINSPTNTGYTISRIFRQKIRIDGLAIRTTSGTCSIQITVNGVAVGATYPASSTPNEFSIGTPIDIDATSASKTIGYLVSGASSPSGLEVVIAASILSV